MEGDVKTRWNGACKGAGEGSDDLLDQYSIHKR